jgi:hypothetical protein
MASSARLALDFERGTLNVPVVHSSYAGSTPEAGITTAPARRTEASR